MTDVAAITGAAVGGAAIGAMFFGGLWWTVRRLLATQHAGLLFATSAILRLALAVAGFYAVSGGDGGLLVACLAGFVAARAAMSRRIQRDAPGTRNNAPHA